MSPSELRPSEPTADAARAASTPSPGRTEREAETGPLRAAQRARDAAEASRDRFAFLAEVSRCLADSLDYEKTLTTVAGMALPYLGAWAIVDLCGDDAECGDIRRLAVLHPDPAKQAIARELAERFPPHRDDAIGAPRVVRTGRPEVVLDISDAALAAMARDPEQLRLLRALGTRAYAILPMTARGETLGAITFVTADAERRFGDIDLVLADDLARRAAMAIDNARLYDQARHARTAAEAARKLAEDAQSAAVEALSAAEATARRAEAAQADADAARQEADYASAAKSQFLTNMSHELRTPLNAILGYAQLLEMGLAGALSPPQQEYVGRVRTSSAHLLALVNEVLDLARVDAGGLRVAAQPALTADAVSSALAMVLPQADQKGVRLDGGAPEDPGVVYVGDEQRVRQILVNLVGNAIKFTPPGGTITINCGTAVQTPAGLARLAGDGPWAFIEVADTGIGIAPKDHVAIFEPFVQAAPDAGLDDGHPHKHGGSGLGLAISRRLARLMGGDLTVESDLGRGATFTLWLPSGTAAGGETESSAEHADRAQRPVQGEPARGISAFGVVLRDAIHPLLAGFVTRLRADPAIAASGSAEAVALENHYGVFLANVAQTLVLVERSGGLESSALTDGAAIQRVISELHGRQRRRLGWTEAQLAREHDVLWEEIEAVLRRASAGEASPSGDGSAAANDGAIDMALGVVRHLLGHARATSTLAFRHTLTNEAL